MTEWARSTPAASGRRARRDAREEPEGAVDVQPGAVLLGEVGERVDRVELARVHLAGVADDDRRRAAEVPQPALEARRGRCLPTGSREIRPHRRAADPEHGERLERARVDEPAREDRHGRAGPAMPSAPTSRPCCSAPPLPGGGERREVGGRGAGRQRAAPVGGQLEELLQPADRDGLEACAERRADPAERVLVERGRQPVGAERRRRDPARDEVEEARPGRGGGRVEAGRELLQRLDGTRAGLRAAGRRSRAPRPRRPRAGRRAPPAAASQADACSNASLAAAAVSSAGAHALLSVCSSSGSSACRRPAQARSRRTLRISRT